MWVQIGIDDTDIDGGVTDGGQIDRWTDMATYMDVHALVQAHAHTDILTQLHMLSLTCAHMCLHTNTPPNVFTLLLTSTPHTLATDTYLCTHTCPHSAHAHSPARSHATRQADTALV
jgi:hypothetical protein